jgi:peptidoglycan/xylan/chitin deacetylase (PgdA/CDA1 family)
MDLSTRLKPIVKSVAFRSLEVSGMNALALRLNRNGMLVLGYHSILEEPLPQPFRYHHTAREFQQHLNWLSQHCEPVGLEGMERWFHGEWTGSRPPAVITFDDGYRNNSSLAADLLTRAGMPAIFFLSTGYVGTDKVLWPDELFVRIARWANDSIRTPDGSSVSLPTAAPEKEALTFRILQSCKNSPEGRRIEYLEYLRAGGPDVAVKLHPQAQDFMSWDEARDLARRGFELGSHTVTHPLLSRIPAVQLKQELESSRATIEARTGARCIAIAYPNGTVADYNPEVLSAVEQSGYRWGFIVSGRWNQRGAGGTVPGRFTIDRIVPPGHVDTDTFSFYASGMTGLRDGR